MTEKGYKKFIDFFDRHQKLKGAAIITQKSLEMLMYIVYPLFILHLFFTGNDFWWKSLIVCGAGFLAVTFLRKRINAQRPYDKYGFEPTLKKDKKGCSFPSRHAFCAAIIAVNVGIIWLHAGIILGAIALLIAALRVILGVHFIRDVAFGVFCGVLIGLIALI